MLNINLMRGRREEDKMKKGTRDEKKEKGIGGICRREREERTGGSVFRKDINGNY